jgi:hypothetical protein
MERTTWILRRLQATANLGMQEDNREAREMQKRALHHIEIALRKTERALADVRQNR